MPRRRGPSKRVRSSSTHAETASSDKPGVRRWCALFLLACASCRPGGVGDPCIPEDEYSPRFGGFDEREVNVESRSVQCETRTCLVNHFRGRASCPYGQTRDDITALPATDPRRCRIPGSADGVEVPVRPQIAHRSAAATSHPGDGVVETVYCSCRCADADGARDDGTRYCDCPSGYACTPLIDDLGLGKKELAGSYCVRVERPRDVDMGFECAAAAKNCGNGGRNP